MAMVGFSTIRHRYVMLRENVDVVRFSFIIQNSLSYLNLDLCEYSNFKNRSRTVSEIRYDFVNTEEKCRRVFTTRRSLLYTLHLDIPKGREYGLKSDPCLSSFSTDCSIPHVGKITMFCCYYHELICDLIECALADTDEIFKLLGILLNLPFLRRHFYRVKPHVMNEFIGCFFPKISDYLLFESFIKCSNIAKWMLSYEKPEILEFLLYHARYNERDLEEEGHLLCELIDDCIFRCFFVNIKPILMYTDAPGFSLKAYDAYTVDILSLKPNWTEDLAVEAERSLPPETIYLILQILWMYLKSSPIHNTGEALRLLWSSYPDPYISLKQIEMTFAGALPDEEIRDMYKFYCDSIGEIPSDVCPRTLQHLCRTVIRRTLKENGVWIPEGIRRTGQPKDLQTFLNLEKRVPWEMIVKLNCCTTEMDCN